MEQGAAPVTVKLVIVTEIIAPYRIPVFNALARHAEIDLEVIFLSENDSTLRQWLVYKEEIRFRYSVLPSWRRRLGRYNVLLNRGVRAKLERAHPNVVVCGGYNYLASWSVARWAKANLVPLLLWSESTAFDLRGRHRAVELLKKKFVGFCEAFVVPGKSSRNYLQDLGIDDAKIFTAPNAVDTGLFSSVADAVRSRAAEIRDRHGLPGKYFLYAGRLVESKGIFDLLDAYAAMSAETRQEVSLLFVGEGGEKQKLLARAEQIRPGRVKVLGFQQREELAEIYALAECLVFPTRSDPWGLVVNEAMACGLPVIATSVAGCTADLVRDGWNGFVVPPRDPLRLVAAMEIIAMDAGRRSTMARNGRERSDQYSPAAWAQGMANAVLSLRHPQG